MRLTSGCAVLVLLFISLGLESAPWAAQAAKPVPAGAVAATVTPAQAKAAVDLLGSMDFPAAWMRHLPHAACRACCRGADALEAATNHMTGYVRFRALVVLSGFNEPRTGETMLEDAAGQHDRLRAVAYAGSSATAIRWCYRGCWPPSIVKSPSSSGRRDESARGLWRGSQSPGSDDGAGHERSGFVPRRGDRSARGAPRQLRAAADQRCREARRPAPGRCGSAQSGAWATSAPVVLADLQRTALNLQPSIAAPIRLLGSNCASHEGHLVETLKFGIANPGYQELVRAASAGRALAVAGNKDAAGAFELGADTGSERARRLHSPSARSR